MEHYLFLARSITHAQRMQKILSREGIRCRMFRAPRDVTNLGCAYAVKLMPMDVSAAYTALYRAELFPLQLFLYQDGKYQEVGM